MKVHVSKDDVVEGKTDERGRVYLGKAYADKHVEVAVLEARDDAQEGSG